MARKAAVQEKACPADLPERARRICDLERQRMASVQRGGELVAEMGRMLAEIRDCMPRGEWDPWVQANLPFSIDTAQRYIMVGRNTASLRYFFSMDRSALYELAEVANKKPDALQGLTPESVVGGRKLRDWDCCDLKPALLGGVVSSSVRAADPSPCLRKFRDLKKRDPDAFAEIADDLAAILTDGSAPAVRDTPGVLKGATRNARADELRVLAEQVRDNADDVLEATGTLTAGRKTELLRVIAALWREVNQLPAG
jgi:DUF3102 family protein